jgi:hypothetical protein
MTTWFFGFELLDVSHSKSILCIQDQVQNCTFKQFPMQTKTLIMRALIWEKNRRCLAISPPTMSMNIENRFIQYVQNFIFMPDNPESSFDSRKWRKKIIIM